MSKLRISQIIVQLVLLDEHDAPVQPEPVIFIGTAEGTAADNVAAWLPTLPAQLAAAGEQLQTDAATPPPELDKTKAELRGIAARLGLKVSGNRAELIARILASGAYEGAT